MIRAKLTLTHTLCRKGGKKQDFKLQNFTVKFSTYVIIYCGYEFHDAV